MKRNLFKLLTTILILMGGVETVSAITIKFVDNIKKLKNVKGDFTGQLALVQYNGQIVKYVYNGKDWLALNNANEVDAPKNGSRGTYKSCKYIKMAYPNAKDGIYTIDPDGDGGNKPFDVYCDMTTEGGGWIVVNNKIPYMSGSSCYNNYGVIDSNGVWKIKPNHGGHGGSGSHGGCGITTKVKLPFSKIKLINSSLDGARICAGVPFTNPALYVFYATKLNNYSGYHYPGWSPNAANMSNILNLSVYHNGNWGNRTYNIPEGNYYIHFGSGTYYRCSHGSSQTKILVK